MTIKDLRAELPTIQLIKINTNVDTSRCQVGDKFLVTEVRFSTIKASRITDAFEIIIFGDTGLANFRICSDCKTNGKPAKPSKPTRKAKISAYPCD